MLSIICYLLILQACQQEEKRLPSATDNVTVLDYITTDIHIGVRLYICIMYNMPNVMDMCMSCSKLCFHNSISLVAIEDRHVEPKEVSSFVTLDTFSGGDVMLWIDYGSMLDYQASVA